MSEDPKKIPLTEEEIQKIVAQSGSKGAVQFQIPGEGGQTIITRMAATETGRPLTEEELKQLLPPPEAHVATTATFTTAYSDQIPEDVTAPPQKVALEDIELRSEEVQEILAKVPNWMIRWGSALFFGLILMTLVICWFVKYPDVIPSETYITTLLPPQKEYAKTTGKIDTLFVKDNQSIKAQTPLAILENTANYQDVFLLKSIIDTITLSSHSFTFPINDLPILFLGEIESDFALFENSYLQYSLNKQFQPYSNEALANRLSMVELQSRLKSLESQKELSESELSFKSRELERYRNLMDKGVISAQEYETKQLDYLQTERNLNNMSVSVSQIREAIGNASKTSKGTEINRVKEEMNLLKSVIQSYNQLKRSIKDWELRYVLKSEIDGKVSFMNAWNTNQTVNTGDLIFTIIPSQNSAYIARLKAPVQNSGKIKTGQTVHIRLENYPDKEFGVLKGTVSSISLVPNKDGFYLIDVALPKKLITTYQKEILFKQEMRGMAEIVTEDLRLTDRFFYQLKEVLKR